MRRDTVVALCSVGMIGVAMFAVVHQGAAGDPPIWGQFVCGGIMLLCLFGIGWGGGKDGGASPPEGPTP